MNTAIIGLQYGDEGKGKVTHFFIDQHQGAVRFSGGPNAGHTVYEKEKKYVLHHLPSGIVKDKPVYLEPGMVIEPRSFKTEIADFDKNLINVCNKVHVITGSNLRDDADGCGLGTTKKGVGPCYKDRAERSGVRVELLPSFDIINRYDFKSFDDNFLFEGAQGILLDIDYGHYPFVTSSSVLPSYRYRIDKMIGVCKAYVTRVGDGPPTRDEVPELQTLGNEFGATTGRPRKCYWLDLDELEYATKIVRPDEIVLTKLDILEKASEIKYISQGKTIKCSSIHELIDALKKKFPIKYLSWSPQNELEFI